ncbi:MAG: hypothetical protein IPJ97_18600 [Proteobacteria bacterium]|nr:hypothetical protein [Pseudomonadota bacterium]
MWPVCRLSCCRLARRAITRARSTNTCCSFPVTAALFNYRLRGVGSGRLRPTFEVAYKIDLEYHLRHSALPYPGGERELGILVSRLHSNPMDLDRPLWRST